MRFFSDNCIPPPIVASVAALSRVEPECEDFTHLRQKFGSDTKDLDWISAIGREGNWTIVSGDPRITRNPHERKAWLESGLTAFFLAKGWMNLSLWEFAWKFIRWWPTIVKQASLVQPGAGFMVPVSSLKLEQLRSQE